MKVAILGYGSQGASSLEYWQELGHQITVCDKNEELELPEGIPKKLGEDYLKGLGDFDVIVRSPSIHPKQISDANSDETDILNKVTTNTSEFMAVCPTRNIIGVTGTKGKGTTSTLIARMLEETGRRVHLGGNIGTPPLEMLKKAIGPDDWVVLELANFQLIDLRHSPSIAVCLMVEVEHQDWHLNMEEYVRSKQQLFRWQKPEDFAVYYAKNPLSVQVVSGTKAKKIPYFEEPGTIVQNGRVVIGNTEICEISDIKLLGEHNWQNVCAAVTAVWQVAEEPRSIRQAIKAFTGLPFRLEFIKEVNGVKFYNDSFGTTPETAIVAIKSFEPPKVLILGGSDKGADYTKLAQTVAKSNVKAVISIGSTGNAIAEALRAEGFNNIVTGGESMEQIIQQARKLASESDIILLSTACASFGLFKNYQERGEQFNRAVQALS